MAAEPETTPEADQQSAQSEASLQAFREALQKSVTIPRERLQEIVDDAVRRGRMTRSDAEELVGRLLSRGREQADDLMKQIEPLVSQARTEVTSRTAPARDRASDAAARARREVGTRVSKTRRRARDRADEPLARADRVRRKAGLPGFPISAYDQLSVPQINNRLRELSQEQLQKVADYEKGNRNRVGVMRSIERKLEQT
jgi:polyhydroxyalkanoate synthesis regulator phasin